MRRFTTFALSLSILLIACNITAQQTMSTAAPLKSILMWGSVNHTGLVALEAIQNDITFLTTFTDQSISPGSLTGGWTGLVKPDGSGWDLMFDGQIVGTPVHLHSIGIFTGGTQPIVRFTTTGNVMGSLVTGSGQATQAPDVAGIDWSQSLELIPPNAPSARIGSLYNSPPTLKWWQDHWRFTAAVVIQGVICVTGGGLPCLGAALGSLQVNGFAVMNNNPPKPIKISDYTLADFETGAVYTSSIVLGSGGYNLLQDGNIAFGGNGDLSVANSVNPALFSDLGPSLLTYQCCYGLEVSGSGAEGGSFTAANQFTVGASGSVSQIDLAVGYGSGVNSFYASIWTDNAGLPGTELARWDNLSSSTSFGGCCGLVTISGISGLSLIAGQQYFLVLGPENMESTTQENWNLNILGVTGLDLYSTDGGNTWNSNGGGATLGAFDILGTGQQQTPMLARN
jgi:hypothetical protein